MAVKKTGKNKINRFEKKILREIFRPVNDEKTSQIKNKLQEL